MTLAAAEARARTMQLRALRRLSECEIASLGVVLEQLETVEAVLVEVLPRLKREADREGRVAHSRGLPYHTGSAWRAWAGARYLLEAVSEAREETTYVEVSGKVKQR